MNITSKNQIVVSQKTNIPVKQRTLMDLNLMDAFLFDVFTEDMENAKKIVKIIIERTTGHTVDNLSKLLDTGSPFETMPEVITIWILPYDPFGENRMVYTVKNMVVENNKLIYNDGVTKIFLFTKGQTGGSKELKDLLNYMEHTTSDNAVDKELLELQTMVGSIKNRKEVGERYMTLQEMINYEKRDSFRDGLEQGVRGFVSFCLSLKFSKEDTRKAILEQFDLTDAQVQNYLELYWNEDFETNS